MASSWFSETNDDIVADASPQEAINQVPLVVTKDVKPRGQRRVSRPTRATSRLPSSRSRNSREMFEASPAPATKSGSNGLGEEKRRLQNKVDVLSARCDHYKKCYHKSLENEHEMNKKLLGKDIPIDRVDSSDMPLDDPLLSLLTS